MAALELILAKNERAIHYGNMEQALLKAKSPIEKELDKYGISR